MIYFTNRAKFAASLAASRRRQGSKKCGKCATEAWQGFGSVESVPRRCGKVSKMWKACHGSVARFRECGKHATEAWQGFGSVESVPRRRGKVSEVWKACHGGVARFPRCGKRATEAWQGFGKCGKRATEPRLATANIHMQLAVWRGYPMGHSPTMQATTL